MRASFKYKPRKLIYKLKPPQIQHSTSWFWGWLLDQSLKLSSSFPELGGAKKLSILIIAAKGPWENPREASPTVEETTGEEAEGNQGQIKPFEKVTKARKFMESSFCLTGNHLGFLQGTLAQSCLLVWKHWVSGTHPRMAPSMGGGFSSSRERTILQCWWAKKGSPPQSNTQFCKAVTF